MYLQEITDEYFSLPNTHRHNLIISGIEHSLYDYYLNDTTFLASESVSLVHYGSALKAEDYYQLRLINIDGIEDMDEFKKILINDFEKVEPDIRSCIHS